MTPPPRTVSTCQTRYQCDDGCGEFDNCDCPSYNLDSLVVSVLFLELFYLDFEFLHSPFQFSQLLLSLDVL